MLERTRRWVARHGAAIGVAGAVMVLVGAGWYQAVVTPPYRFIDEQAHVGYVLELQQGRLPTIDTPIDADAGGPALRERLAAEPERRRDVWVANNPPLTYLVAVGPSALTRALGLPGGPLLGLRLVNLTAAAGAVVIAYLLGRDLAGGDRSVGLVAAGLVAATPHLGFVASVAFNDGMALLATTGVTWALARVAGAGGAQGRRAVVELGLWCALAAAVRPMALAFAAVAGALGLVVALARRRDRPAHAITWLVGPTLVASGWAYARNVARYGDATGSARLFEKFGRSPGESLTDILTTRGIWESVVRTLTTRRLETPLPGDPIGWYRLALVTAALGVVAAGAVVMREAWLRRSERIGRRAPSPPPRLPLAAWATTAGLAAVPVLLTAQHRAGGGASHPRYLLATLPMAAAVVAFGIVRLGTRWSGLGLVAAVTALTIVQTRTSADWLADNPSGLAGTAAARPIASGAVRNGGLVVTVVGLALLAASVAVARPPGRFADRTDTPTG